MELKVWVEGIQRIVCGVNEKTTCQDVVFALAHATGKTGRFTLIERWRNSERLLAPSEQPLKVLLKWGEHSNDVQFILQWQPLDAAANSAANKSGQLGSKGPGVESSCSDNSASQSPLPLSKPNPQQLQQQFPRSPSTGLGGNGSSPSGNLPSPFTHHPMSNGPNRKSPHSGSTPSSYPSTTDGRVWNPTSQNGPNGFQSLDLTPNGDPGTPPLSLNSGSMKGNTPNSQRLSTEYMKQSSSNHWTQGVSSSDSSLGSKIVSSPPPYREPPSPCSHPNPTPPLTSPPTGSNSPASKNLPPYREPPPPNLVTPGGYVHSKPSNGASPTTVSSPHGGGNHGQMYPGGNNPSFTNMNGVFNGGIGHGGHISSQNQQDAMPSLSNSSNPESWKPKDHSLTNGDSSSNKNGPIPKASPMSYTSNSNSNYREIIRVVNSQREKLTSQQAELTQYDAELMFWEGKAREQQKHIDLINKEISRLEVISAQHESQAISLAHLEEEHDYSQRESAALKAEINGLRTELETCDDEIEQCKSRIKMLMNELQVTQQQMAQRQDDWLDKETSTIAEIEKLRKELDMTRMETDAAQEMSGNLDQEVQSIEAGITEKKKQMERLVAAMKEANLQSLSIQPPDELMEVHHRSGSTRRMIGSPRQLENAAPTSKNPHGVWV